MKILSITYTAPLSIPIQSVARYESQINFVIDQFLSNIKRNRFPRRHYDFINNSTPLLYQLNFILYFATFIMKFSEKKILRHTKHIYIYICIAMTGFIYIYNQPSRNDIFQMLLHRFADKKRRQGDKRESGEWISALSRSLRAFTQC